MDTAMICVAYKDFYPSIRKLTKVGGLKRKTADKAWAVYAKLRDKRGRDAFAGLKQTANPERRIRGCVKYELGNRAHRLVTVQTKKMVLLCFVGSHEDTDRWLDANSGLEVGRSKEGAWEPFYKSPSIEDPIRRKPSASSGLVLSRLENRSLKDKLLSEVPATTVIELASLEGDTSPYEIEKRCKSIQDDDVRVLVYDVLCLLLHGHRRAAESRIERELVDTPDVDDLSDEELLEIVDGDEIRRLRVGTPEYERWFEKFARSAEDMDWLLFLHPEQKRVIKANFSGPATLSGVSGSGKTCIGIHRAVRLAEENPGARVLVVTLNRSLSGLIEKLVTAATEDGRVRNAIEVSSFFQLCQKLLRRFEPENEKLYLDVTWKLEEHIDEVFREYYRTWYNNDAAEVLLPIHQSLISQGLCAETYIGEEFDWIRSAVVDADREKYLGGMERTGRRIPIGSEWRSRLLEGLSGWEKKMRDVGVIDYMGLTTAVSRHFDELEPCFDHVVVDEAQDFGTCELKIIRKICAEGPDDLFLCGDIAQHVLPKHRSLSDAGINARGRARRIVRNYRNTREILKAAYEVLIENLDEEMMSDSDLEILDPAYANRSSNQPVVLAAESLEDEIGYARTLVKEHLTSNPGHRCCIAFAGYSIRDIKFFGRKLDVQVLHGGKEPLDAPLVFSDLEQTKGYEFNMVIIVNCSEGQLPPQGTPPDEAFRHGCRLYVAMTRARDDLYLSYSGAVTPWLKKGSETLSFMEWKEVVEMSSDFRVSVPERIRQSEQSVKDNVLRLKGRDFLYTPEARGLSMQAIRKIDDLVDGTGLRQHQGHRVKWRDMETLYRDIETHALRVASTLGPNVRTEILGRLSSVDASRRKGK